MDARSIQGVGDRGRVDTELIGDASQGVTTVVEGDRLIDGVTVEFRSVRSSGHLASCEGGHHGRSVQLVGDGELLDSAALLVVGDQRIDLDSRQPVLYLAPRPWACQGDGTASTGENRRQTLHGPTEVVRGVRKPSLKVHRCCRIDNGLRVPVTRWQNDSMSRVTLDVVGEFAVDATRLADVCERYGIAELAVFGSVARGVATTTSDVDLLYVVAPGRSLGFAINRLEDELAEVFGRRVDLVAKRAVHRMLRDNVLAEARTLYAA